MEGPFNEVIPLPSNEDDESFRFHHDVVVSGAGPAGLLLGVRLREMGVNVALVDPHLAAGTGGSKAAVTMPRSLEAMGPAVSDKLHGSPNHPGMGRRVGCASFGSGGEWIAKIEGFAAGVGYDDPNYCASELGCRYSPLAIGQNEVEKALAERYHELGGVIYRAARVTSVKEDTEGVSVGVERYVYVRDGNTPDLPAKLKSTPKSTVLRAKFAVGADGKSSSVRDSIGVDYGGKEYSHLFFLSDIVVKDGEAERGGWVTGQNGKDETLRSFQGTDGTFLLFVRVAGNRIRTYYAKDGIDESQCNEEYLRSEWKKVLPGGEGLGMEIESVEEPSLFRVACRLAATYLSKGGRVFLIGDAAHCHSPAGGQGMNTSLQDAYNLSWKLANALERDAGGNDPLLATYEVERRPVAQWVLSTSDQLFAGVTSPSSPLFAMVRNAILKLVFKLTPSGSLPPRFLRDKIFGLTISYRDVGTCIDSGKGGNRGLFGFLENKPELMAGDRLSDLRCNVAQSEVYLHDLLGRSTSNQSLVVVSGTTAKSEEVAKVVSSCIDTASKMNYVSNKILIFRGKDSGDEERKESAEVKVIDVELPASPTAISLASLLGIGDREVAMIAVRPDTYISFVCRGKCGLSEIEEGLQEIATRKP